VTRSHFATSEHTRLRTDLHEGNRESHVSKSAAIKSYIHVAAITIVVAEIGIDLPDFGIDSECLETNRHTTDTGVEVGDAQVIAPARA
jgi:hypothetical protein